MLPSQTRLTFNSGGRQPMLDARKAVPAAPEAPLVTTPPSSVTVTS